MRFGSKLSLVYRQQCPFGFPMTRQGDESIKIMAIRKVQAAIYFLTWLIESGLWAVLCWLAGHGFLMRGS